MTIIKSITLEDSDFFIPKSHYTSDEFSRLEAEKLWPKVWQMACRLEDIPVEGSFTTYEILEYSIVIIRGSGDEINAFHNVCPHRGNQIAFGQGNISKLTCRFHGWQWNLNGNVVRVKERGDWDGCPGMKDSDLALKAIKTSTWGGFVFINLDPDSEPFEEFIDPVQNYLDCLEFEKMTYIWSKSMPLKANWKTTLESFMESYHLEYTHPQTIPFLDGLSVGYAHGKHGKHGYPNARPTGAPATCSGQPIPEDIRGGYVTAIQALADQIGGAVTSQRSAKAVKRIMDELPSGASALDIQVRAMELMKEAAETDGAGFPTITPEQGENLGAAWNVFPNMVLVFSVDTLLAMRARPNGGDPNSCVFDMWGLMRQSPEKIEPIEKEFYQDWKEHKNDIPYLLVQDLNNIENIQKGMKSPVFKGSRANPLQEVQIINHHKVLKNILNK